LGNGGAGGVENIWHFVAFYGVFVLAEAFIK
jgi:hypothetical protein